MSALVVVHTADLRLQGHAVPELSRLYRGYANKLALA